MSEKLLRGAPDRPAEGCWEWQRYRMKSGYGQFHHGPVAVSAHRAAWEVANGPIPAGMAVCHSCDNPPCVRPDHLFLGTLADNNADMDRKGRHNVSGLRRVGADHHNAKLTEDDVRLIRATAKRGNHVELAARYGISQTHLTRIVTHRSWTEV